MDEQRRALLKLAGNAGAMFAAIAAGLLRAGDLLAAEWNKAGFEAKALPDALKSIGAGSATESKDIIIKAPEIAENGAVVPIEVTSRIPGGQNISILVEKNPQPLAASFDLENGAQPFVSTRIKMGETSRVRVVVAAGGKYYTAFKEVKVTIGGCGG